MIKQLQAALIFLFVTTVVQAQQSRPLGQRVGLQLSSAAPIGEFEKIRFEDDYPPFANSGFQLSVNYARDIKPGIALGGTAGWRRNPFYMDRFVAEDDALVRSKEATAWQTAFALADAYLQMRGSSFFGYVKGSLGGAFNESPRVHIETVYGPVTRTSDSAFSLAGGLAFGLGVEAQRIGLGIEIGSLLTKPSLEVSDAKDVSMRYRQTMRTINASFGVYYSL
ncbi:hypothetical protein [Pontibacter roseus]|uniref:hypothetical protein n=1 Tax=Pontibacter roseus TaxID=336989 RepID=UPI0003780DC1|nr:hypothetical protein [Pontibacter roseus]